MIQGRKYWWSVEVLAWEEFEQRYAKAVDLSAPDGNVQGLIV